MSQNNYDIVTYLICDHVENLNKITQNVSYQNGKYWIIVNE